ncbi:MAG: class SAM-dependent methyltransferase [Herbinix sp.]|jgi:SAM-dependent methyltransferase|nr:class SAM-dependent methyltransferase [Herbinix sp.]
MQPYTGFATLYDLFMDNVPYDDWTDYVVHLLKQFQIEQGLVLELGCGTGSVTRRLAERNFDMIGIDSSEEMLSIAREKSMEDGQNILYLCQDMREFELYGTVAAVVSVCDSMNYIVTEEDLLQVFRLVNNYLDPGGIFIFDLDTQYAYEEILGDSTIAENREEGSFIWENTYYEEDKMNEINLTLFIPRDASSETSLYEKQEETHYRRAYSIDTIKSLVEEAEMDWVAVYDTLTEEEPTLESERVYIIVRERLKKERYNL